MKALRRPLALLLSVLLPWIGCEVSPALAPSSGAPEYQRAGLIAVPGGQVNAAGGNLLVDRLDLAIDTPLGRHEIRAHYNALSGSWRWSFEVGYDGLVFVDPTGAVHDVAALADGEAIPGSIWIKASADRIESKGGRALHFDASGRLVRRSWRGSEYPRLEYDWSAASLAIASCPRAGACLVRVEIERDGAGRPLSLTDPLAGHTVAYAWDSLGRLTAAPGFAYEYAPGATLLTAITSDEGERIEYAYQAGRRISTVRQVGAGSPIHRFAFYGAGSDDLYVTMHWNPLGGGTRLVFDGERRLLLRHRLATDEVWTQEWSGLRPTRRVEPGGVATELRWEDDALVELREPSGNIVTFQYEPAALCPERPEAPPVRRIDDLLGLVEERFYDAAGRPVALLNGAGEVISLSYHEGTAVASLSEPDGVAHDFPRYGLHGHWLERSGAHPDRREFDAAGNAVVPGSLDRGGGVLSRTFDAGRELASLEMAATENGQVTGSSEIRITRRSDGRLAAVERPGGGDHVFVYDAIGRLVERRERVDGAWQSTHFEHDAAGNMTSRTRPNGMREEWEYDVYGRPVAHRALRDGELEGELLRSYDAGRLHWLFDSIRGTAEVYTYDSAGRVATITFGYGEVLEQEWDLRSRLVREVFSLPEAPAFLEVERAYDAADREVSVSVDGEVLIERTWVDGRITSIEYGNGLLRAFAYEPETGLLAGATTLDAEDWIVEETVIERTAETGPPRGQILTSTATPLAETDEEYWLGLGVHPGHPDQRVGKRVFGWRGGGDELAYAYDGLGNPAADADGDAFLTNAEGNRLLSASLASEGRTLDYTWDAAGFATSRDGVSIEWTATGRLATYGDAAITWDMRGLPVTWTAAGFTREFPLFAGRVDAEGAIDLGEVAVASGGVRRYRHEDFRGNTRFVSDETGEIVSHYAYTPYGVDRVFGEGEGPSFAGGRPLGELLWLGARIYDPAVGRFLSPDPVFHLVNAYAYAMGNPVWFSDPDGLHEGATGEDVVLDAISLALATAALFALTASTPSWVAVVAGIAFFTATYNFVTSATEWSQTQQGQASGHPESAAGSVSDIAPAPGGGGSSSSGVGFSTPGPIGCAPTGAAGTPDLGWLLLVLLPLQLVGAVLLLRRRRRS